MAAAAVLLQGCWERKLAGKEGEECAARRLGSQSDVNYSGLGVRVLLSSSSSSLKEVWGLVERGG